MREPQPLSDESRRILFPSVLAAFLPFLLLWLPPDHWRRAPLIAAVVLMLVIVAAALRYSWEGPSRRVSGLAYGYVVVVALLRGAGGASGVLAMMLLPVCWMALYGSRRQLWSLLVAAASVFVIPLLVVGGRDYPPNAWRAGILFVTLSAVVGTTVQALVSRGRAQELERERLLEQLDRLAHTDDLTGLPNRRAWQGELERGLRRALESGLQLSVAMIDIDSFKAVNDRDGHQAGDVLLVSAAAAWSAAMRPQDILARIGGDEFALLMPGCGQAEAELVTARLQGGMPAPYSCSVGLAMWNGSELSEALVNRSDKALYEVKRNRRASMQLSSNTTGNAGQHRAPTSHTRNPAAHEPEEPREAQGATTIA